METTTKQETVATVAQPQTMAGELVQLKELTGGNPVVTIVLVLAVLLLGSGAGIKMIKEKLAQKHELEMKKLEMESAAKKAETKTKGDKLKKKAKEVKGKK
jgi:uncharacterized protein HemX